MTNQNVDQLFNALIKASDTVREYQAQNRPDGLPITFRGNKEVWLHKTIAIYLQRAYDLGVKDGQPSWQPIVTAPRDRRILVVTKDAIYSAFFVTNFINGDTGWAVGNGADGNTFLLLEEPTHWMPLPESPEVPE